MINIIEYINEYLSSKIVDKKPLEDDNETYDELPISITAAYDKLGKGASLVSSKMDAWHNGERRENFKAASDAKLIVFFDICKKKGYKEEMRKLETEANRRGWSLY